MKLLLLSKENVRLAQGEAEALLGKGKLIDNIILINTKKTTNRLAYTKLIMNLLFEASKKTIEEKIRKIDWNKIIKGSFALEYLEEGSASHSLNRRYGGMIYDLLKHPVVDLDNPDTKVTVVQIKNKIFLGIQEWKNEESFYERRPSVRPGHQPITLSPKLARACVNLTGSRTSIYDPFCGVGGFLIESGLMRLKTVGSDISSKMLSLCKKNLQYYGIKKYEIFKNDALEIKKKYEYIVTDPPYGKASRVIGKNLYSQFLKELEKILKKRAIVIFPSFVDAKKLLKTTKLKIKANYSVYVHKTLSRNIYILEN